jgi:tripartite-type tricarboxylate transporter receptor subunit TctC
MKSVLRLAALLLSFFLACSAQAEYPNKPIKLVVPFAAGSFTDSIARIVGQALHERLGQPIIVDPKPGASSQIAADFVAKAAPDGYTLFMTTNTSHSANPAMFKKLPYDPIKDFSPILLVGEVPFVLVVNIGLPVKTTAELIAYARANPGKLSFPYPSSTAQVAGETLRVMAKIDAVGVPYKSSPQAATDLISGQTQFYFIDFGTGLPHIKSAKMRALAFVNTRSSLLPGVPAMSEGLPGFALTAWNGVLAPAGTPKEIITRLNAELRAVLARPELRERLNVIGLEVMGTGTPEEFGTFLQAELPKWAKWVKDAGIQPE